MSFGQWNAIAVPVANSRAVARANMRFMVFSVVGYAARAILLQPGEHRGIAEYSARRAPAESLRERAQVKYGVLAREAAVALGGEDVGRDIVGGAQGALGFH